MFQAGRWLTKTVCCGSGYDLRLPAAGTLGTHRIVEAMKHAFALRMNLGDPGPDRNQPFVNVTDVLDAMLSPAFADQLRCAMWRLA